MTSENVTLYLELVKGLKALGAKTVSCGELYVELSPDNDFQFTQDEEDSPEDYLFHSA